MFGLFRCSCSTTYAYPSRACPCGGLSRAEPLLWLPAGVAGAAGAKPVSARGGGLGLIGLVVLGRGGHRLPSADPGSRLGALLVLGTCAPLLLMALIKNLPPRQSLQFTRALVLAVGGLSMQLVAVTVLAITGVTRWRGSSWRGRAPARSCLLVVTRIRGHHVRRARWLRETWPFRGATCLLSAPRSWPSSASPWSSPGSSAPVTSEPPLRAPSLRAVVPAAEGGGRGRDHDIVCRTIAMEPLSIAPRSAPHVRRTPRSPPAPPSSTSPSCCCSPTARPGRPGRHRGGDTDPLLPAGLQAILITLTAALVRCSSVCGEFARCLPSILSRLSVMFMFTTVGVPTGDWRPCSVSRREPGRHCAGLADDCDRPRGAAAGAWGSSRRAAGRASKAGPPHLTPEVSGRCSSRMRSTIAAITGTSTVMSAMSTSGGGGSRRAGAAEVLVLEALHAVDMSQ